MCPPPQQVQFLSFSHMFSPKSVRVGGRRPPTGNPGSATDCRFNFFRSFRTCYIFSRTMSLVSTFFFGTDAWKYLGMHTFTYANCGISHKKHLYLIHVVGRIVEIRKPQPHLSEAFILQENSIFPRNILPNK